MILLCCNAAVCTHDTSSILLYITEHIILQTAPLQAGVRAFCFLSVSILRTTLFLYSCSRCLTAVWHWTVPVCSRITRGGGFPALCCAVVCGLYTDCFSSTPEVLISPLVPRWTVITTFFVSVCIFVGFRSHINYLYLGRWELCRTQCCDAELCLWPDKLRGLLLCCGVFCWVGFRHFFSFHAAFTVREVF